MAGRSRSAAARFACLRYDSSWLASRADVSRAESDIRETRSIGVYRVTNMLKTILAVAMMATFATTGHALTQDEINLQMLAKLEKIERRLDLS